MKKILLTFSLVVILLFCSCKDTENDNPVTSNGESSNIIEELPSADDMFSNADKNISYDESDSTTVVLNNTTASTESKNITISDGFITVTKEGYYIFTGNGTNQTIVVDANDDKVHIVLSNLSIDNDEYATIYVKSADKVFILLEGDNYLTSKGLNSIDDVNADGAIFAKDDITIQGEGKLTISSVKHGIVGKDDVKITGGDISINSSSHGVDANDSIRITDTKLTITALKDGLHVENEEDASKGYVYIENGIFEITSKYDGIDASSTIQIDGGDINILAGGGNKYSPSSTTSTKGIKAASSMLISSGNIVIDSSDDCIHSNGSIEISGGTLTLSSGDDGIHADTSLIVSNGNINVLKSYEGLEAQNITISGGVTKVKASDDGINAAGGNDGSSIMGRPGQNMFNSNSNSYIVISGGENYVNASGDGIDANGSITISGGFTVVEGPTDSGNAALDYDSSATITGGVIVAIGSSGMAQNFSQAEQGCILVSVTSQSASSKITLTDSNGTEIVSIVPTKSYSSVLISSPELVLNGTYSLTTGSTTKTISLSSLIYGSTSSMGGIGIKPGRP